MPAIVEFPSLVQAALEQYGELFANQPERQHFAEYLTGLLVAERKTVSGINREFAVTTDQSCLNRWINEVDWDSAALNRRRLTGLQRNPATRYAAQGVIAIDNTLIDHDGKLIEDVGWFWDHAEQRHKIAHDYLIAQYVCPSGRHYALEFRRFRKREDCEAQRRELARAPGGRKAASAEQRARAEFKDHTTLCLELVDWVVAQRIPGDFTFDSYFTHAAILNHLDGQGRGYVGDLKSNRKLRVGGRVLKASEWAAEITPRQRKRLRVGERTQYYFTKTVRLPEVEHAVRIVILWSSREARAPAKILVTNRVRWEVTRIVRVYRRRWTGTECFHRDGKQHLGLGDCQLRHSKGQTRHLSLVIVAHSLLVSAMGQGRPHDWALAKLTTIGEACGRVRRENFARTIEWALERAAEGWTHEKITSHLALA